VEEISVQNGKDRYTKTVNAGKLSPLESAVYVLRCIYEGKRKDELVQRFDGDEQLVSLWLTFLKANDWLQENQYANGQLEVSEQGRQWLEKFELRHSQ
jgi:hypothetical protein